MKRIGVSGWVGMDGVYKYIFHLTSTKVTISITNNYKIGLTLFVQTILYVFYYIGAILHNTIFNNK